MSSFASRVCLPEDRRAALEMLYSHLPEPDRKLQIDQLLSDNVRLVEGLILCECQGKVVGAMLNLASPGRTLMIWPPVTASDLTVEGQIQTLASLLRQMRAYARKHRSRLVQMLLTDDERALEPVLLGAGFFYLTRLLYLRRIVREWPVQPLTLPIEFVPYSDALRPTFLEVLDQSYQASLDCPEVNGIRDLEDILDSHQAQGEFRPDHWLLARWDGEWAGCLLLAGLPELQALEVAYVSVLPAMRGRGVGRELTRKAIQLAAAAGVEQVTLAVDQRNTPARRLYDSEHFEQWESRHAYLLVLDPADGQFARQRT